jgi:sRNA-binding protein
VTAGDQRHARAEELLVRLKAVHETLKHSRPLHEKGVEQALIEAHPEEQAWLIRLALHRHVNSDSYLQSLSHGGPRFGLTGAPVGQVSLDERHHAHALLKHHRAHRHKHSS